MKVLKNLVFTLVTTMLVSCTGNKPDQPVSVILMGGQSNMVGQGKQSYFEKNQNFENITFYDYGFNVNLINSPNNFGPEIGLSMELEKNFPNRKFILIKYAIGGASLLDWTPNYSKEKAEITGHPEFGNMYNKLLKLTDSLTTDQDIKIEALLWMQGERDARIPDAGVKYEQNFELLINSIRKDFDHEYLPIIYGKINPPKERYPALKEVLDAQIKINKKLSHTYIINTDSIDKWDDNLHYSSKGQIELGKKFGSKLSEILHK